MSIASWRAFAVVLLVTGCSGGSHVDGEVDAGLCVPESSSTLPHVRIELHPDGCVLTLSKNAALTIPYTVTVDQPVEGFVPAALYPYGAEVANLEVRESVSGTGQHYCVCDKGLPRWGCPASDGGIDERGYSTGAACGEVTIPAGTWSRTFTWTGHNWNGPSDTMNPLGAAFPPGVYDLKITTSPGSVADAGTGLAATATLRVAVVP